MSLPKLGKKKSAVGPDRAFKSNLLPAPDRQPDPALENARQLVDIQFKPLFSQLVERGRGDYAAFASDFLDIQLHEGQKKWLHTYPWALERMLSSGNRFGKTFSNAVKLLHDAFYQTRSSEYAELINEYYAVNLSLTIDMSRIAWDTCLQKALDSKLFRRFVVQKETVTAPFPQLVIGTPRNVRGREPFRSEIWARSSAKDARYILGRRFDLISYDEAARDPHGDKILDEVLRMRLADRNGRIDLTSTAAGKNWFFRQCQLANSDKDHLTYYYQTGSSYDNPYISHERLLANEGIMARQWVEQNLYGGFADYMNVFNRIDIEAAYADLDYPLARDYNQLDTLFASTLYQDLYSRTGKYLMAIDWALKRDDTVILVARTDVTPCMIVYAQSFGIRDSGKRWDWDELKRIAVMVHRRFNNAVCMFDATSMAGEIINQDLSTMGMVGQVGYNFAGSSSTFSPSAKEQLILVTQQALQNRVFRWAYIQELFDQLLLYDRDDKSLATDWVFAFALLCENLRQSHQPQAEFLNAPFIFDSVRRNFNAGYTRPDPRQDFAVGSGMELPDPLSDRLRSGQVLTSTGWNKEIS